MSKFKKNNKESLFSDSFNINQRTYQYYLSRLTELATSMFEWKNVPSTVDVRFLELSLFSNGYAVFFKDEILGYLALECMLGGKLDVYRIPTERRAYATNGYNMPLNQENSVIIYNNYIHTNCTNDIELYARRLYEVERTIDVNIHAQKTPILIQCSENQRLTMQNLYKEYEGNVPFIFGDKNLDINGIKCIKTDAPLVAGELISIKTQIWNDALTYLGISNVDMNKKERLITDEVTRNMGSTVASRYSRLEMRKKACAEINKMFGLNIDVEYRNDLQVIETDSIEEKGGEDNE